MADQPSIDFDEEIVPPDYPDTNLTQLLAWLKHFGFRNTTGIKIKETELGRGCVTSRPIEREVMSIPRITILSDHSSIGPNGKTSDLIREHVKEGLEVVGLFLFYEKFVVGEASFWKPWIQILPEELTNTIFFNDVELSLLQGSSLLEMTHHLKAQLADTWQHYCSLFVGEEDGLFPKESFTLERYKWALATAWARTFLVSLSPPENPEEEDLKQATAFIPLADMLNYSANDPCGGDMDETYQSFRVWSNSPLSADQQIFIEYGSKGNTELLLYYGFVLPNNPYSVIKLSYTLSDSEPFYSEKLQLIKGLLGLEPYATHNCFEVTLRQGEPNSEANSSVLPFLRLHAICSLQDLQAAVESTANPLSVQNETSAMKLLAEKCISSFANYPTTIEEDEVLLKSSLSSRSEYVAILSRLEEKRMYRFIIEQAEGRLISQLSPLP